MKISEVVRQAAKHYLWDGHGVAYVPGSISEFSCIAVAMADKYIRAGAEYVYAGGLAYHGAFDDYPEGPERQAARKAYMLEVAQQLEQQGL